RISLWVQASLDYKQRLQQRFFPEGVAYDRNRFNRTAATAPLFNYLAPDQSAGASLVSRQGLVPAGTAEGAVPRVGSAPARTRTGDGSDGEAAGTRARWHGRRGGAARRIRSHANPHERRE